MLRNTQMSFLLAARKLDFINKMRKYKLYKVLLNCLKLTKFYMLQMLLIYIVRSFLAHLAFAVCESSWLWHANRFSIVYINDYFHLEIDIRHVIMIRLLLSLFLRKDYYQVTKRDIINPSILLYNCFRSNNQANRSSTIIILVPLYDI